ncbi:MAG: UMP kinase, partial [Candidatus Brocadiia bacterium]|nr:UMP kinase [Candidatus Brocadiia bacterium]
EVVRPFGEEVCRAELEARRVLLLAGGTGNPLFTTDTAAALRAVQLGAEVVLKATRVDGAYSADPEVDPAAVLYERLSYEEVMARNLGVMDMCAVSLCREHAIPVRVFNYKVNGNIRRALQGEPIGTLVGS